TPEAQEGWLQLFDGETTMGWKIDGEAKVQDGVLVLGGTKETKAEPTTWFNMYDVMVEMSWEGEKEPAYIIGPPAAKARSLPEEAKGKFITRRSRVVIPGRPQGHPVSFVVPAGRKLSLRTVKLNPFAGDTPGPKARGSLFNGTDLTGWKVFKGNPRQERSKFTVTREGWLNVKDGAGDLQTEKLFDDFVLQLECISNGKHLNSGIFFRAIPGEYQQGYEAQIHNNFTESPPRKYTVDVYDPSTNKLTGKKTVESAAKDFGTGAIYRRLPARKGMAKDGEWFTMTVVAQGRHIATWVNGVQQVDWTDNRPANKNGRNGYRAEAGAISIQGHDTTTD